MTATSVVLDASAAVDLLVGAESADWVSDSIRDRELHAPGHFHAEVLNALGRLHHRGALTSDEVGASLRVLALMPVVIGSGARAVEGAWERRDQHSLPDALYVELASRLGTVVVTVDRRLASATPLAVAPPG